MAILASHTTKFHLANLTNMAKFQARSFNVKPQKFLNIKQSKLPLPNTPKIDQICLKLDSRKSVEPQLQKQHFGECK